LSSTPSPDELIALHRRAAALARTAVDGADAPYYGLMRVVTGGRVRDVLLGRRAVMLGEVAMVDWERSPLAEIFFTHKEGDEYELEVDRRVLAGTVVLRHLVTFDGDEPCVVEAEESRIVDGPTGWITEPNTPPQLAPRKHGAVSSGEAVMLDATQRGAVELAASRPLLVLGEAGFGKTTVALHRIAWLARNARDRGDRFRGLVVVPNEALRRLARMTLDRLGAPEIEIETYDAWVAVQARRLFTDLPARFSAHASPVVSRLKRHAALREVLDDIVRGTEAMRAVAKGDRETYGSRELLLHLFGDRDLMRRVVEASRGALTPGAVAAVASHTRLQFTATTEERFAHVDADRLVTLDGQRIDENTPMHDAGTIDVEDCTVLLELLWRSTGRTQTASGALARYDHIVVDEAQELASLELAVLGRARADHGAVTVAGDDAQQIDETVTFAGWPDVMRELAAADHTRVSLATSYRCPPAVETIARAVVGRGGPPSPDRPGDPPVVWHRAGSPCHLVAHLCAALVRLRERDRRARIAIICRHAETATRLHRQLDRGVPVRLALDGDFDFLPGALVTSVDEVRGLEFDHVVVPDASPGSYPEDASARRAMYVALTRTMHQLWLMTASVWSPLLRGVVAR
jgi:DNA helicase IV